MDKKLENAKLTHGTHLYNLLVKNKGSDALYNLSDDYVENVMDEESNIMMVDAGSISVMTYEGFEKIAFNEETQEYYPFQITIQRKRKYEYSLQA
jgi:hypothetical protein